MVLNLFKVDFVQGKTDAVDYGQVVHGLVDTAQTREIISLMASADKLQSVSNYSREPKRLEFECFIDGWIEDYLLSGDYEHERYISHYEVKVYRDGELIFSGIIDTSLLSYEESSGILKVTCYDKIRLLALYADLTHLYSITSGYEPRWILAYYCQDIARKVPISLPYSSNFTRPGQELMISEARTLLHIDYDDMLAYPVALPPVLPGLDLYNWTYSVSQEGWVYPKFGYKYDVVSGRLSFIFAHYVIIQANYPDPATSRYLARYRVKIYKYHSGLCPIVYEYEENSGWKDDLGSIQESYNAMINFLTINAGSSAVSGSFSSTENRDGRRYGSSQYAGHWVEANFWGKIFPSKIHPGRAYETRQNDLTENIKALQAMMMMYNATLFCDAAGNIVLKNKDSYASAIIEVHEQDVVKLLVKRGSQEKPDMAVLDVLAGDKALLKELVSDYLIEFYGSLWSAEIIVDQIDRYALVLQSKIRIRGVVYVINELERDYVNDEYKLSAWRID